MGGMEQRRKILVHGFAMLTFAFALGLVAGPLGQQHHPHARLWLGAHITGILAGILLIGVGLARPYLQLGARAGRAFYWSAVGGNWIGMLVLGVFNASIGGGTAIVTPELAAPAGWQGAVIVAALAIVTITTFLFCGLGLYGLRASAHALNPAADPGRPS